MMVRGPDRGGGTDPGRGFAGGELQHPDQELGHGGGAVLLRQVVGFGVGDQPVIDQRQPVAEGFEASATPRPSPQLTS